MDQSVAKVLSEFVDTLNAYGSQSSEVRVMFTEYPHLRYLFNNTINIQRELRGGRPDIPEECWGVGCTTCDGACENAAPGPHKGCALMDRAFADRDRALLDAARERAERHMDLKQDDKVRWTEKSGLPAGEGRVKGFASTAMAVIGRNVIIEVLTPDTLKKLYEMDYKFTHICLFETALEKAI